MADKWRIVKIAMFIYGVGFAAATITNSIIALVMGNVYGTHEHVILRAVVLLIITFTVVLVELTTISRWIKYPLSYVAAIGLILGYTWLREQLGVDLHPNAYSDIFLSVTIFFVPGCALYGVYDFFKTRRKNAE